jgi:homoserine dehydrogenase
MKTTVGVGLLGCGTVGSNVADRLQRERDMIERRSGVRYELRAIAIQDSFKSRSSALERRLFTRDARSVVDDPHVDLVIEVIGGTTDAAELVERALERGRHVVTANKDLLGEHGPRLQALAASRRAALRFEGAVGGAIPVVRTLGEALAGDEILSVAGVVNGTCATVLCAMEEGAGFDESLARAQRLGYAEADPSNDIEGVDSAHKLAVVAQLAFGLAVISPRIARTGISAVTQRDVARARMLGFRIRHVAAVLRTPDGVLAEVAPVLVPQSHEFARTAEAENVVQIAARDAGRLVLRGTGAGGAATASAVLGDIVSVLQALGQGRAFDLRGRWNSLETASRIEPFFDRLSRTVELPNYAIWDDALTSVTMRALVNA